MKQEDLRKVEFSLVPGPLGFTPDDDEAERQEELTRKRMGYFHTWSNGVVHSADLGKAIEAKVALIEDAESGDVFEVTAACVKFVDDEQA